MSDYIESTYTVHVPKPIAQKLIDDAEILFHEDQMPGVPAGVFYDTVNDRWTWSVEEALVWALETHADLAEGEQTQDLDAAQIAAAEARRRQPRRSRHTLR